MRRIKRSIVFCIALICVSCSDFLDVEPGLQISINEQLSTEEGVLQAYNGIYADVEELFSSVSSIYADLQGGNLSFTPRIGNKTIEVPANIENSYSFNDIYNISDYESYYRDCYEIINQVNILLERLTDFTFFTQKNINQLEAELLTIRALMHYQVSIHYAQNYHFTSDASHLGVVYNRRVLVPGVDFPRRETMYQTNEFLKEDIDKALDLYTNVQLLSGPNYSYFNSTNTRSLYARIALQMNDWSRARDLSDNVISNSGISLTSTSNYIQEWEANVLPIQEVVLEFSAPLNSDGNVSSSVASNYFYNSSDNYARQIASGDIINLYESSDIRRSLFLEQQLITLVNGLEVPVTYSFTKKFQGDAGTLFIRLSEMYLIRAEANARLGNNSIAVADINTIRNRAGLANLTNTSNILEEIFLERRKELAFEGFLLFDIIRYKKDVVRDLGCLASLCNLNYPSNNFILPIPASSADANQNIQQNEGY